MALFITSGRLFVRKCTKHLLTLWGTQPGKTSWFDETDDYILSLRDERRRTHDTVLFQQTRNRKQRYAQAKSKLQKKLRAVQNAWWDKIADELQQLADGNSSKGFFAVIKQVHGSHKTAVVPIRDAGGSQMLTACLGGGNILATY